MNQLKKLTMVLYILSICGIAHAQSMYMAKKYYEEGKYLEAAKQLRPLADGGNAEAQYLAAKLFLEGKGVNKNKAQAEKYYRMSALQGYEKAMAELCNNIYLPANDWTKSERLVTEVLDKNDNLKGKGYEYYIGMCKWYQGGDSQKLKDAWMMMFKNKDKWNGGEDDVKNYSNELYPALIKENIGNPTTLVNALKELWNANHTYSFPWIDDLVSGIRKQSKEIQSEYYKLFKVESEKKSYLNINKESILSIGMSRFVVGLMQMEGLGTQADMISGNTHVNQSYVLSHRLMQDEISKWQDIPEAITGKLKEQIKQEQERKAQQDKAAKEKAERERKLANIKVVRAPYSQITAYLKSAKYVNGKLEVVVTSTSKLALSSFQLNNRVIVKNTRGLSIPNKAKIKVSGLKSEIKSDGRLIYYFNEGNVATFTITISDMSYTGELGEIYFDFNMSGSKEYIRIQNLIW